MKNASCTELPYSFPTVSEAEDLYSTYVVNCVSNSFLCYTAIMLNIVTIHAIRKTSSLPKTLKTLLLSLAVSDVGVGLFTQSLYSSLLVKWLQRSIPSCGHFKVFFTIAGVFSLASFLSVVAVSVDRFLAIHLHLRYQELVTHKRVVAVVISIWVLSAFLLIITLWISPIVLSLFLCTTVVVGLALTTLVYIRIYLAVRRHKNQMEALQEQLVQQHEEATNFASLVKSVVGVFYVYLVFLICYLPFFICLAAIKINGPSTALKGFLLCSMTLVYLNSSLNPVIYCWKMRHILHAIMDVLRNMSWLRNCALH
ncbi:melanocortin receptor 3-like [Oculina patagonica]